MPIVPLLDGFHSYLGFLLLPEEFRVDHPLTLKSSVQQETHLLYTQKDAINAKKKKKKKKAK